MERRDSAPGVERRVLVYQGGDPELRVEGDANRHIIGHAAVFDRWATLMETPGYLWREIVRPGAFRAAIAERQDVRALFNHDDNFVLGRTTAGTLSLSEDSTGLLSDTDPPDTQTIRDLVLAPIARRDITQMSFSFQVRRGVSTTTTSADGVMTTDNGGERVTLRRDGDRIIEERELLSVDLFDVSPVTYPAYENTDVALRERGAIREAEIRQRVLADTIGRKKVRLERMRMRLRLAEARMGGDTR